MSIPEIIQGLETIEKLQLSMPLLIIITILMIGCIRVKGESLWHKLFVKIGKDLNGEVLKKVDDIDNKLDNHIKDSEREKMLNNRQKIIRFSDEVYQKRKHSKEHYEEVIGYIDEYEEYCNANPDFPNNKALFAIDNIKKSYQEHLDKQNFEWE